MLEGDEFYGGGLPFIEHLLCVKYLFKFSIGIFFYFSQKCYVLGVTVSSFTLIWDSFTAGKC